MNQREVTRYNLKVPAHVETMLSGEDVRSYEWQTRDISSKGVFLLTNGQLLEKGTNLKVNLYLNSLLGSQVTTNGRVIRTENEGIGVCFDGKYEFISNAPDMQ